MQPLMEVFSLPNHADVEWVRQYGSKMPTRERQATTNPSAPAGMSFCRQTALLGSELEWVQGTHFSVERKYLANRRNLFGVDDELSVPHVIAERHHASHPHALPLGGGNLVANALGCYLPLELGEGQDVQRQPSMEVVLNDCVIDTNDTDRSSKTSTISRSREAGQSVDLVDDHTSMRPFLTSSKAL